MLKRKYESDSESESNKADRHEDIRHTPVKMVVTIDEEGNLNMKLDGGSLIVARKALSLSSPVFHAMLGSKSKFQESANKTFDDDGIQVTSFPDDNYQAMITVTRIMHHQSHQVSNAMAFQHLYQVAVLCDKYDLKRCLGPWIDRWAEPYLDSYPLQGYEGWLFMSRVFGYGGLFKEMTRHLILNSEISEMGEVVIGKGHDIGERMSEPLMGKHSSGHCNSLD